MKMWLLWGARDALYPNVAEVEPRVLVQLPDGCSAVGRRLCRAWQWHRYDATRHQIIAGRSKIVLATNRVRALSRW